MSLDSAANLLMTIGANTDDAEENIARFRALLGKDLDDLAGDFSDWAEEVLGEIETVKGAMIGVTAIVAAGAVALGGMLKEAASKYEEYVETIERGTRVTGLSAEQMSALHFAASQTDTSFESLTHGLTFFEAAIVRAREGSQQQALAFQRLGISQAQLTAGEHNMMPVLELAMDRFHNLASGTEKAAIARDLFSRGGTEMIKFLSLGSQGLHQFSDEAKAMGLVIGEDDIRAMETHKAATRVMKEELEAMAIAVGREVLPVITKLTAITIGMGKAFVDTAMKSHGFWKDMLADATAGASLLPEFFDSASKNIANVIDEINKTVDAMSKFEGADAQLGETPGAKEAAQSFRGLRDILDRVQERMAAGQGEYEKIAAEMAHMAVEVSKARAELTKLSAEGKISAEDAKREAAALGALPAAILNLWSQLNNQIAAKQREADAKRREELAAATAELVKRIQDQHEKTLEVQEADWNEEINKLVESYRKKGLLTTENEKLLADLREQGLFRLHRDQVNAFGQELLDLQNHLASILEANMNSEDKLTFQHDQEIAQLKRDEAEKLKITKEGSTERQILLQQFAINEKAINDKYAGDLQALQNSSGWQGIFGSKFSDLIKGDEDLSRQWAQSTNQSLMMVKVTMEGLRETGTKLFEGMVSGMGGAIAQALVYKKSIGEAMEAALASTLENLAGQAITYAIYSTALGFLRLAEYDYEGAGAAFTSAAIWATVGAAAGLAGRALSPSQGGAGGSGGGLGTQQAALGAYGSNNQAIPAQQQRTNVQVNVYGHVVGPSGISELTGMINDAVLNQDVTLTATNTRTGVQVTR